MRHLRCSPGLALCGALMLCAVRPAAAQDSTRIARITYLTADAVYLDAGRDEGLRENARVTLLHGGQPAGELQVQYVSSHRSSCSIVRAPSPPAVGDSVRFVPAAPEPAAVAAVPSGGNSTSIRSRPRRVRGRVGLRYLVIRQKDLGGAGVSQPALDIRMDGAGLGGSPLGVTADVRARRTTSTQVDGSASSNDRYRVYQLALSWNSPGSPLRMTLGRQFSAPLATVSFFDGLTAEYDRPAWSFGLFGGTQPDAVTFGYSSDIRELGGYFQLHNRPAGGQLWTLTLGGVGSYGAMATNREFAFLSASYTDRKFSFYGTQEVDYNRSWKVALGDPTISPTSTFLTASYRLASGFSVHGGFDNRRNVRLYRDLINPETQFDDSYRQGVYGGMSLAFGGRYRVGLDARSSRGGGAGPANAYTVSLGAERLTSLDLGLHTRSTRYTTPVLTGWLHSADVAITSGAARIEINGGVRLEHNPLDDPPDSHLTWLGADLDLNLTRAWYFLLSIRRERGGIDANDQLYGGISWRF